MIGQFNRTLQIIYLDEIYFFSHIYVYAWCYLYRKYIYIWCQLWKKQCYSNQIDKNPGLLFHHSFSEILIYTSGLGTNQEIIYKPNQHLRVRVNLNSSLSSVFKYKHLSGAKHLSFLFYKKSSKFFLNFGRFQFQKFVKKFLTSQFLIVGSYKNNN